MIMGRFKPKDRVILTARKYMDTPSNPVWNGKFGNVEGIVTHADTIVSVRWDNGSSNNYSSSDLGFANKGRMNPNTEFRRRRKRNA